MAKQRFQFNLKNSELAGWGVQIRSDRLEMIARIIKQGIEQEFLAQLNSVYSDASSPEYKKHLKNIPFVAKCYAEASTLITVYIAQQQGQPVVFRKPPDELFDQLGIDWLTVDQFDDALGAFKACVEISKPGEGPWWAQRHCARYNHLGFAHMILGNKQDQLQASLKGAAYAVAILNSAVDRVTFFEIFQLSFCNLAIQISDCNPDDDTVDQFRKDTSQSWEYHVAERRRTLQEKLASGNVERTKEDLCFALADFLIHHNRDAIRIMLEFLRNSSSFESISASEPDFGPATREFQTLIKVCRMDTLDVTPDAEDQGIQPLPTSHSSFAVDLLEVAILELPSEYEGWSLSVYSSGFCSDAPEIPSYPGLMFILSIKDETTSSPASSSGLPIRDLRGTATLVPAEGSNHEELKAIIRRLKAKKWNLKEQSDSVQFATVGRDLAHWATTSPTSAVTPFENVEIAVYTLNRMTEMLRLHFQHRIAKRMLQDFVPWFIDQPNPKLKEICMEILLEYIQMCELAKDDEEKVNCSTKALKLADEERMVVPKFRLHLLLGNVYMNMNQIPEAEKELHDARNTLTQNPALAEDVFHLALMEAAEGYLENCRSGTNDQTRNAISKLETSLKMLEKQFSSNDREYHVKANWILISLRLSEAVHSSGDFPRAHFICSKALKAAKELQMSFRAADAAWTCGNLAAAMGNFLSAQNYYREGLQELDVHGSVEDYLAGRLHGALGETLLEQSLLPEAEAELRQAVDACSRVLMERNLTSEFRIRTFESLKMYYNNLQSCLFQIYQQTTDQSEKGIKAMEALIAAEQGRCRDLTFNLEKLLKSRDTIGDGLSNDHSVDKMDWKRFDVDKEYAWAHLKHCMTVSVDAIKKQNSKVQRVTFVEYTVTRRHLLIWVLHSHGTQEPSSDQASTALPSMFSVDILANYENLLATDELPGYLEEFKWMFGPRSAESHYDFILQNTQAFEAIIVFEKQIEYLRNVPDPDSKKINALYKLLIKPFGDQLVEGEPVIFIPHEGLSFIPFAALKPAGKKAKHLIQNHPIGTASSLRTLGWATNQYTALRSTTTTSSTNPILLVADPKPLGVTKDPLDDSVKEVTAIATTTRLDEASVVTLTREQATLKNVTAVMKSSSWCHIACHGEVNSEYPHGVLFLSRSGEGDVEAASASNTSSNRDADFGFLTPEIIANDVRCMRAHAAVLSACKVGLGTKTGEGLLGMSRAFLQAGVPVVLAPLRTVDSGLCRAFMHRLYERMVKGESVMFALSNTMVDVLEGRVRVTSPDGTVQRWQLWDWAAWLAVGFPGVCLPLCAGEQ